MVPRMVGRDNVRFTCFLGGFSLFLRKIGR